MPTRDELIAVLAKDWRDSGYDLDFQRTADAVLALFAAQIAELTAEKERLRYIIVTGFDTAAGVAVPEPDEQIVDTEYPCGCRAGWSPLGAFAVRCDNHAGPAASPVAQEDGE